jgi:hypothetical protein
VWSPLRKRSELVTDQKTYEPPPAGGSLEELVDAERANLMQVQAMARCLYDVLLYSDDDDGVMHADVAKVIARLIEEVVDSLAKIVRRFKAGEFGLPPGKAGGAGPAGSA